MKILSSLHIMYLRNLYLVLTSIVLILSMNLYFPFLVEMGMFSIGEIKAFLVTFILILMGNLYVYKADLHRGLSIYKENVDVDK